MPIEYGMGRPPVAGAPASRAAGGTRARERASTAPQICRLLTGTDKNTTVVYGSARNTTVVYGSAKKTETLYRTELGGEMVRTDLYTTKTSDLVRSGRRGHDLCHMIGGGVRGEVWRTEARELLWLVRVRLGSG